MNKKNSGVGILLIMAGLLFFLIQTDILNWSIKDFKWIIMVFTDNVELTISLIFIVIGINVIFKKYSFVKVISWLTFFAVMIAYGYYANKNIDENSKSDYRNYAVEKLSQTEKGQAKIKTSAISFALGSTELNLLDGEVKNTESKYNVEYTDENKTANVKFETDDKMIIHNFLKNLLSGEPSVDRKCELNINSNVIWDLSFDMDAADSDMDLTNLKVKKMDVDVDASNIKLILGKQYEDTKVEVDADASKVKIYVPIGSGVRAKVDADASSTSFKGIEVKKDGLYYLSENFNEADNKIDLDIDIDAGALEIIGEE